MTADALQRTLSSYTVKCQQKQLSGLVASHHASPPLAEHGVLNATPTFLRRKSVGRWGLSAPL